MVTATLNICGCLLIVVILPLTVVTNYHLPATVGVHQMMCEITKCVGQWANIISCKSCKYKVYLACLEIDVLIYSKKKKHVTNK